MLEGYRHLDMSDVPRAFLTPRERAAVRGEEMDESTRSSHFSRIRRKLPKMKEDARLLREHHDEFSAGLQEAVCEEGVTDRLAAIERRLDALEERVDEESDGTDDNGEESV